MNWTETRHNLAGWTIRLQPGDMPLFGVFPWTPYGGPVFLSGVIFPTWEAARSYYTDKVNDSLALIAEDGKVAYVESGRDCDCVEYSGHVHIVDATLEAYETLDREIAEWADGPYRLDLTRVSETRSVKRESRDLAMEAYEDGHPHYIVSNFP